MENLKKVKISNKDLEKLKKRKIGEGRDSIVYAAGKGLLYKVYKDESNLKDINQKTKIYKKSELKNKVYKERNCYIDADGVKLYYRDAIKRIIQRQEVIKKSHLPKAPLYINKFSGCVLKRIYGIQLHYAFPFLSKKRQAKILRMIIEKVKELTDHYVYPLDIANSPIIGNHSNILLDFRLNPQLIDLDGNSTVYRECYDESMLKETYLSLNMLFLELIYGFNLNNIDSDLDLEQMKIEMKESGIDTELINKLFDYSADYNDLEKLIKKRK